MSSQIELEIHKLLSQRDAPLAADELLKRWLRGELSPEDQVIVGNFLINAGFLPTLKDHYLRLLSQNKYISWTPLFEFLNKTNTPLSDEMIDFIFAGAKEQNNLHELLQNRNFAFSYERLKKAYSQLLEEEKNHFSSQRQELLNKLQRAIHDDIEVGIEKTSQELERILPNDPDIQNIKDDVELAKIKKLLRKKEREGLGESDWIASYDFSKEIKSLFNSAEKLAKKNSLMAYDCAILFAHIEAYKEALMCLQHAPDSLEKDWLKMELLIRSQDYLTALSESLEIEKKYFQHPQTLSATLILRAQALYGLDQKEKAIQILEKVLKIQPKNQKARLLLQDWRNSI